MTVYSEQSKARYRGNGITTTFAVPFSFLANADGTSQLGVYIGESDVPLIEGKDYTVSGAGDSFGGEIVLVTAPEKDAEIAIIRNVPRTQEVVFKNEDKFPAEIYEKSLDKLTMEVQEVKENLTRALVLPPTSDIDPLTVRQELLEARTIAVASAAEARASEKAAAQSEANAAETEESVEQTFAEMTSYVAAAKVDINNTKTAVEADITATKEAAETSINNTKDAAVSTINTTVSEADVTIKQYVEGAETEVQQIARNEAEKAIARATTEATENAKANVNTYVDDTVKPDLQTYVSAASASASAAAESAADAATKTDEFNANVAAKTEAFNDNAAAKQAAVDASAAAAQNAATAAATSETNAQTSAYNAANQSNQAKDWATKTDGTVDGSEYSSKYYANQAAETVASINPEDLVHKTGNETISGQKIFDNAVAPTTTLSQTSGTVALAVNKIYSMTISGTTTFKLPTPSNTNVFNQIKIMAHITGTPTINWGTTNFFNKATPEIEEGSYDIYFDYDKLLGGWVCGVLAKGVAE